MTSRSPDAAANRPLALSSTEIDELLSMTLIANLATLDDLADSRAGKALSAGGWFRPLDG